MAPLFNASKVSVPCVVADAMAALKPALVVKVSAAAQAPVDASAATAASTPAVKTLSFIGFPREVIHGAGKPPLARGFACKLDARQVFFN